MSNDFKGLKQPSNKDPHALIYKMSFTTSFIVFLAGSILLLSSLKESNGNSREAKLGMCLICVGWCLFSFSYLIQQFSKDARASENAQPVQRLTICNGRLQEQLLDITSNYGIAYLEIILIIIKEKNYNIIMPKTDIEILADKVKAWPPAVEFANSMTPEEANYFLERVSKLVSDMENRKKTLRPSTSVGSSSSESVQPTGNDNQINKTR